MSDKTQDQLKQVIETQHGGSATLRNSWQLQNIAKKPGGWDGIVHVYDLENNALARSAYAWSVPINGSSKMRYFAVLHMGRVNGAIEAVKAAVSAISASNRHK